MKLYSLLLIIVGLTFTPYIISTPNLDDLSLDVKPTLYIAAIPSDASETPKISLLESTFIKTRVMFYLTGYYLKEKVVNFCNFWKRNFKKGYRGLRRCKTQALTTNRA